MTCKKNYGSFFYQDFMNSFIHKIIYRIKINFMNIIPLGYVGMK